MSRCSLLLSIFLSCFSNFNKSEGVLGFGGSDMGWLGIGVQESRPFSVGFQEEG